MNEKEVIKRCQNGDRAAFDELIRAFYPYVSKYLLKLTRDEALTSLPIHRAILWMCCFWTIRILLFIPQRTPSLHGIRCLN